MSSMSVTENHPESLCADLLNGQASLSTCLALIAAMRTQPTEVVKTLARRGAEDARAIIEAADEYPVVRTVLLEQWLTLIPQIEGANLRQSITRIVATNAATQTAVWREAAQQLDPVIATLAAEVENAYVVRQHYAELRERHAGLREQIERMKHEEAERDELRAELARYTAAKDELSHTQLRSLRDDLERERKEFEQLKHERELTTDALRQAHLSSLRSWLEYLETFEARARRLSALPEVATPNESLATLRMELAQSFDPNHEQSLRQRTEQLYNALLGLVDGTLEQQLRHVYESWGTHE